jgi:hypothetical protein
VHADEDRHPCGQDEGDLVGTLGRLVAEEIDRDGEKGDQDANGKKGQKEGGGLPRQGVHGDVARDHSTRPSAGPARAAAGRDRI